MSQKHFKDDPRMGLCFLIEGEEWQVTDVWVDIAEDDDAPRSVTLDQVYGEDFGLHMRAAELDKMKPIGSFMIFGSNPTR